MAVVLSFFIIIYGSLQPSTLHGLKLDTELRAGWPKYLQTLPCIISHAENAS
jgi:hypothetical protein